MPRRPFQHNPAFLTEAELRAEFVVRLPEKERIVEIIRENRGPVNQQALVIAPRGMGKTMLLRRVALAVCDDPELSRRWLPILLPEEKYDIATAGELWLEALGRAAPAAAKQPDRWRQAYERLRTERDPARLREAALARLRELADQEDRRLLLVAENLNMIFGEQAGERTGWEVRETLLSEPRLMLLGSATARFDEIDRSDRAMYDLFRVIDLGPLSSDECRRQWRHVAGNDLSDRQIRAIEILTGGNPRLLAILAGFSAGLSFQELMNHLIALIDNHTSYFKANVESLPPQERRVFTTLAGIWDPSTARDVASFARLDVNTTSSMLRRLVERGAVLEVERTGRKAYYQLAERLFNIYYLMRQSGTVADRARAVVEFMARFYGTPEVVRIISEEAHRLPASDREPHVAGFRHLLEQCSGGEEALQGLWAAANDKFLSLPEIAALRTAKDSAPLPGKLKELAGAISESFSSGKLDDAIGKATELIDAYGHVQDFPVVETVAGAVLFKGIALGMQDRFEEAFEIYEEVDRRFGKRKELPLASIVASSMINRGVALSKLGRCEEVIEPFDEVVRRFGERQELPLADMVAMALVGRGLKLAVLDRDREAIESYDEVVRRFGQRQELSLAEHVATALANRGAALRTLGRFDEAIESCDEVVRRFGDRQDLPLAAGVATALVNKAAALYELGQYKESIESFDEVVSRFGQRKGLPLAGQVTRARLGKGLLLCKLDRYEGAIESCEEALRRIDHPKEPPFAESAAPVLFVQGIALYALNRQEEARQVLRDVFRDAQFVAENLSSIIDFAIMLARRIDGHVLAEDIEKSPAKTQLEPLMSALRLDAGEKVRAPKEVMEVARDILSRIRKIRAARPAPPSP